MLLSRFSREDDIREWYVALCAGICCILSFCAPIICLYFDILILKRLDIRLETDHAQWISKGFSRRFFIQSAEKLTVSWPLFFSCILFLIDPVSFLFKPYIGVVKPEECRCCMEVNRCREMMEEVEKNDDCITLHPGFDSVCLKRWVLQTAGIGLKTKSKKSYTTMLAQGHRAESVYWITKLFCFAHLSRSLFATKYQLDDLKYCCILEL